MTASKPCILVYNPLAGHGHLDSWFVMFVQKFLAKGYQVLAMAPNADVLITEMVANSSKSVCVNVKVLPWQLPKPSIFSRICGRALKIAKKLTITVKQHSLTNSVDPELNYLEPVEFANRLVFGLGQSHFQPALVLNMYMDLYRTDIDRWQKADKFIARPWAGIRFIPSAQSHEAYYYIESLKGMLFLDETAVLTHQQRYANKTFAYLPDITDATLPDQKSELAKEIEQSAKGRKIVFMGGSIGKTKNLAKWLELVGSAPQDKWYFVQVGEVHEATLSVEDLTAFRFIQKSKPENFYLKACYLEDEKEFNEIINTADIIFAVYRDFSTSSNMLGKAAAFEKPILVANNHLMGARVTHYQIGACVQQDDVATMLSCLESLLNPPPQKHCFENYRNDFSHKLLADNLFEFVDSCAQYSRAKAA